MEEETTLTTYTASDGSPVKLTRGIVARYIITGNQDVDDKEIYSFIAKCQARKLNPLAGDAYMTSYKDQQGRVSTSVVVSKDYFVRTATQQPTFDGFKAGVIVIANNELVYREGSFTLAAEQLVGGWAEVYDKGRTHPVRAEVSLAEYDQHRALWKSKPATMIRKVALVQALRETYPGSYGGIYDADEMPEPVVNGQPPEPVITPEPEPEQQEQPPAQQAQDVVISDDLTTKDIKF